LREQVTLDGVLVGDGEGDLFDLAVVLMPDAAGPVARRVEGYLDLHPAGGPKNVGALVAGELGGAGEGGGAAPKVKHAARQPVGPQLRVALHNAQDAL